MATLNTLDSDEIIKDEQSLVLSESDAGRTELSVLIFTGKRGLSEDIPIDSELVVTTTTDERSILKDMDKQTAPTTGNASSNTDSDVSNCTASESRVIDRKYKDMVRKRQLRQSAEYRQQETNRSRNRMKVRRSDPAYRDKERERDRKRRQIARANNPDKRALERERDRLYKKRIRDDSKIDFVVGSVSHEIILIDGTCTNTVVIEPVVKESD